MRAMKFFAALVAFGVLAASAIAQAQTYPDRPVTIVVPAPPGGGMDAVLRTIGEDISAELGQRLVLENKSGANGEIGARYRVFQGKRLDIDASRGVAYDRIRYNDDARQKVPNDIDVRFGPAVVAGLSFRF